MNIFLRELKANFRGLIIWSLSMAGFVLICMSKFSGISGSSATEVSSIMRDMPAALKVIFGISDFDIATAEGYFGFIFIYLLILVFIHAAMLGAGIISKEERDKTVEFLIPKPVSRAKIIAAKLSAAIVNVLVVGAVTWVSSDIFTSSYNNGVSMSASLAPLMIGMMLTQLLFLAIGAALAAAMNKSGRAAAGATAVILATYFISVAAGLSDKLKFLRYFTPFRYFSAEQILLKNEFDPLFVLLTAVLCIAFTAIAFISYNKRDMKI